MAARENFPFMDAANVDLKAFAGVLQAAVPGHLGAVLETLEYLKYKTRSGSRSQRC